MIEHLQIRIHGDTSLPTLVYLPGMHGDWTLVSSFRAAIAGRVRFVEFAYPRTVTWSLEDYAAGIEETLLANGIERGWLLGESFGSQVVWALMNPASIGIHIFSGRKEWNIFRRQWQARIFHLYCASFGALRPSIGL